jgi:hypothetical protein
MASETHQLHLDTIWARHEGDRNGADEPQFVAAFPATLSEYMPELFQEWLHAACRQYRDEVDVPVDAFLYGGTSIDRPQWHDLDLIEDNTVNPGWEEVDPDA